MKLYSKIGVMLLIAAFMFAGLGFADDRDLTYKGITELETMNEASTGDKAILFDASTGNVKTTAAGSFLTVGRETAGEVVKASSSTTVTAADLSYAVINKQVASGVDASPGTTLIDSYPGKVIVLYVSALSAGTWVVTPTTATGFTTLTFNAVNDVATLLYVNDTVGWIIVGLSSVAVA